MLDLARLDLGFAVVVWAVVAALVSSFAIAARRGAARPHARVASEPGLPLVGKTPVSAVYAAVVPVARVLTRLGVSANAVTVASFGVAASAGVAFAVGHFGLGSLLASIAALADAVDGLVARESGTASPYGKTLDTVVDRYVDAVLLGGVAMFVRRDAWALALTIGAIVGSFMVSYASSVLRELGASDHGAPMRRAHRVAYIVAGASLVPIVQALGVPAAFSLSPLFAALTAIAVIGNYSAVRRLLGAASSARVTSGANVRPVVALPTRAPRSSARAAVARRASGAHPVSEAEGLERSVARERLP